MNVIAPINYDIALESYYEVLDEIKSIFPEHKDELALYDDIELDPEYEMYESLYKLGFLRIYTVRVNKALVGYAVYFVRRHYHYRQNTWAISDIILIRKKYREIGLGTKLFDFIETDLRRAGVDVMHTNTKAAHPELAMLLKYRGHQLEGSAFSMRL